MNDLSISEIQRVIQYMQYRIASELKKSINQNSARHRAAFGCFYRALAWMKSLAVLWEPVNFQAVSTGVRSMLELVVDLGYLHNDKSAASGENMEVWEDSARLNVAEQAVKYYQNAGLPIPENIKPMQEFFAKNERQLKTKRQATWNQDSHPSRWYKKDLFQAVKEIDRYFPDLIKSNLGRSLTEFYRMEYGKMNWFTHGSALAGLRGGEEVVERMAIYCFLARRDASDLSMLLTKMVIDDFGISNCFPEMSNDWEQIQA